MSFANENNYLANLNVVDSDATEPPPISQDDLAAELEFWSNTQFTFDVPPDIGLLNDFDVSSKGTKQNKEAAVAIPTANIQGFDFLLNQTQVIPGMTPFIAYTASPDGTPTPVVMQPMVIAPAPSTSNLSNTTAGGGGGFPIIYPAHLPATVAVSNNIAVNGGRNTPNTTILPKKSSSSRPQNKTEQKIAPTPTMVPIPRKNSTSNSAKGQNKSITSQKTTEKKRALDTSSSRKNLTSTKASSPAKVDTNTTVAVTTPASTVTAATSTTTTTNETQDDKKKIEVPDPAAKIAAEEDKRKRNTAASARFRIKKKLREQALEQTAKEMTVKADMLEGRVKELELEIKWLRSLIVEKDPRLLDTQRPDKRRKIDE